MNSSIIENHRWFDLGTQGSLSPAIWLMWMSDSLSGLPQGKQLANGRTGTRMKFLFLVHIM